MMKSIIGLIVFWAVWVPSYAGESSPIRAEVSYVSGSVEYVVNGENPRRAVVGAVLPQGAVIRTGHGASVDIHLGYNVLLLRLTQNSVLTLNNLTVEAQPEGNAIDVQLTLNQGVIVGQVTELPATGKFEVKLTTGVASVRDGRFRIHAEGYIVQLQGLTLFAYVPRTGEPKLQTLQAPPPLYFTPREGIRRAPPQLIREVTNQLQPRRHVAASDTPPRAIRR